MGFFWAEDGLEFYVYAYSVCFCQIVACLKKVRLLPNDEWRLLNSGYSLPIILWYLLKYII
jgi:hypothetical protein